MSEYFPIQRDHIKGSCPNQIPWALIAPHNKQAQINHCGQTLERLKERGGLSPCEAIAVIEDRKWEQIKYEDSVARLKQLVDEFESKQPCPQCAEKDMEIARLNSVIPGSDEFDEKVHILAIELSTELRNERDELKSEVARLNDENSILRTLIAKLGKSCHYCGLEDMSQCVRGFPGCTLADDILCGEEEAFKSAVEERNQLKIKLETARKALAKYGGGRSSEWRLTDNGEEAQEALKQIGE